MGAAGLSATPSGSTVYAGCSASTPTPFCFLLLRLLLLMFIWSWCQHGDQLVFVSVLRQTLRSLHSQPRAVGKELDWNFGRVYSGILTLLFHQMPLAPSGQSSIKGHLWSPSGVLCQNRGDKLMGELLLNSQPPVQTLEDVKSRTT